MSQDERCANCPNPDEDGCPPGAAIECDLSKLTLDQLNALIGQLHDRMQALEDQRDAIMESVRGAFADRHGWRCTCGKCRADRGEDDAG